MQKQNAVDYHATDGKDRTMNMFQAAFQAALVWNMARPLCLIGFVAIGGVAAYGWYLLRGGK